MNRMVSFVKPFVIMTCKPIIQISEHYFNTFKRADTRNGNKKFVITPIDFPVQIVTD
jgi:hypothetical protein